MAVKSLKLAVGTGAVTRGTVVSQGDFSLMWSRDVLHCETIDGVVCVHPNGASIVDYAPGSATFDGAITQQISKNLTPWFSTAGQGNDARVTTYSATKITALPNTPNPGDSIILEKAGPYIGAPPSSIQVRRGVATAWSAFQFTNTLPAPGRFSGPVGWWNLKVPVTYDIDLDAKVAALPSLSLSGVAYPPVTDVITRLDRYWGLALLTMNDLSSNGYEAWVPQASMDGLKDTNYGEYLGVLIGAAGNHLIGDVANPVQKYTLFKRLVQIGKEIIEGGKGVGKNIGGPTDTGLAGHNQWEFIPILCYLWSRDLNSDLDNLRTLMPTCILGQPFYWTSGLLAQLAPHDNTNQICISRRRAITAVSGTTITYATNGVNDAPQMNPISLIMTRESDGATASILTVVNTLTAPGTQQVTINAQPGLPFQVGDIIYFQPGYAIVEGDADWRVFQADKVIVPTVLQPYRNQQMWLDEILFPHALGIWRADWDAARDYVLRCMGANPEGFPLPWEPSRSQYVYSGTNYQFDKTMWDAHWATVSATP